MKAQAAFQFLFLFALTFVATSHFRAQAPEYVPSEGLVAWYPLDGTAEDLGSQTINGSILGPTSTIDRWGNAEGAMHFEELGDRIELGEISSTIGTPNTGMTLSCWFKGEAIPSSGQSVGQVVSAYYGPGNRQIRLEVVHAISNGPGHHLKYYWRCPAENDEPVSAEEFSTSAWNHYVMVVDPSTSEIRIFLNGVVVQDMTASYSPSNDYYGQASRNWMIGSYHPQINSVPHQFFGDVDEVGIWDRALTDEEILALFESPNPAIVMGCTDEVACNFDPEATEDDGSCLSVQIETSALEVCEGESITAQAFVNSVLASFDENYATVNETGAMLVVPTEYESVQAALSASADGDTILVMPGQYVGTYDFPQTHGVHLISAEGPSETVLDGNNSESVIAINGEFEYSVKGFTITRGRAFQYSTICNGKMGGGMEICGANTVVNVEDNLIVDNAGMHRGGGIRVASPNCIVRRNVIAFNTMPYGWANYDGGAGVCIQASDITFENNTVAFNNDSGGYPYGAGVHMNDVEGGSFRNNIIFHNLGGPAIWRDAEAIVPIEFCNVDQDISGEGNLNADPLFVDAENNDFHLNEASPCIDAGHPSVLDADGTVSDLGALPFYQASAGLGVNLAWSTGDTTSTIQFQPQESTTLEVQATLNGVTCSNSTEITVHSNGCADEEACNFNADDFCSITCVYPLLGNDCEAGAVACATGTVWDAMTQTCVIATLPYLNEPGELAELNPCYFDTNFNGLVEVTDLMNLLSVYSMSCAWEE